MNIEDEELVKMVNPTLKRRETILFLLIVVINGLKCIVSDIGLDTCTRGKWKVEVSKLEINQRKSALVTKFSQPRAWISLKRASAAPQSKLCCVNLLKESECRASVQIVSCNSFLYTNNIQKHYSVSRCVISIIIVIAPTHFNEVDYWIWHKTHLAGDQPKKKKLPSN